MEKIINNSVTFPCNYRFEPMTKNWKHLTKTLPHLMNTTLTRIADNYGLLTGEINNLVVVKCKIYKELQSIELYNDHLVCLKNINVPISYNSNDDEFDLYFRPNKNTVPVNRFVKLYSDQNIHMTLKLLTDGDFTIGPGSFGCRFVDGSEYLTPPIIPLSLLKKFG